VASGAGDHCGVGNVCRVRPRWDALTVANIIGGWLTRIVLVGGLPGRLPRKTEHISQILAELASAGNAAVGNISGCSCFVSS
jgi:hypothetical protein